MPEQIVVTSYAEMAKVLPRAEEAASMPVEGLPTLKPAERAQFMYALHEAMAELRNMPGDVPGVAVTPRHHFASLLQSAFAEAAEDSGRLKKAAGMKTLEAKFDNKDPGWITVAWQWLKASLRGPIKYKRPGKPESLPSSARVCVFGDWGSGLYGAPVIGQTITGDAQPVDVVLHLGDTYYSGTRKEFEKRFVPHWPRRTGAVSRSLNGNHEMYSSGKAYRKTIEKEFGQKSTVFSMANDHWVLIGADTAVDAQAPLRGDGDLGERQLEWIEKLAETADERKIILCSHHQPFSRFDSQGPKLIEKLKPLLNGKKIFAWYWGHEHNCVLYEPHPRWGMLGRCIGHGGFPAFRDAILGACPKKPKWKKFAAAGEIPECRILDGPNEFLGKEAKRFMPHGYATLTFDGPRLLEEIRDPHGQVLKTTRLS